MLIGIWFAILCAGASWDGKDDTVMNASRTLGVSTARVQSRTENATARKAGAGSSAIKVSQREKRCSNSYHVGEEG